MSLKIFQMTPSNAACHRCAWGQTYPIDHCWNQKDRFAKASGSTDLTQCSPAFRADRVSQIVKEIKP